MRRRSQGTFDERVAAAAEALQQASSTVQELEDEISARRDAVERLEQKRKVLEVDREQLEAVTALLNEQVRQDNKRAIWIGVGSNAFFFVLGVIVTLVAS